MSGVYADVTGPGSETAARLAIEDFGGKVLGRPIELLAIDHQNKADLTSAKALGNGSSRDGVEAILEVVGFLGRTRGAADRPGDANKIVMMNAPAATKISW